MLKRYDQSSQDLLPYLTLNKKVAPSTGGVSRRTALVRHNVETTYVVPRDWPKADGVAWFHDGAPPAAGSDVHFLIDGAQTFEAMVEALETASKPGDFIILLAWSLDVDFEMVPGKSFLRVVKERADKGVAVRVLLFDHRDSNVYDAKEKLNKLRAVAGATQTPKDAQAPKDTRTPDVYCNLDDNTRTPISSTLAEKAGFRGSHALGSHHHKILVVYGDQGLVGFCGGVDLDKNRLNYYHDVHVRVVGDAVMELLKICGQRWAAARDDGAAPTPPSISGLTNVHVQPPSQAPYISRVVQTVGNPDIQGVPNTLWAAVSQAIRRVSRFIYIEDQYFWSRHLIKELVAASKRVKHITVLVPPALVGEYPILRHRAMHRLVMRGGNGIEQRIGIFEHHDGVHDWVHAKLFIVDDEYALVGTANANNRGYFHDSEASVGIAERAWNKVDGTRGGNWYEVEANFARRLRIKLWAEHLGLPAEEMFDGIGARVHWDVRSPRTNPKVQVYQAIDMNAHDRTKEAYAKEFKAWEDNLWRTPMPVQPWARAPWWEAPYEDWYPEAFPRGVDSATRNEALKENWLFGVADPTTSEGQPIMKLRL